MAELGVTIPVGALPLADHRTAVSRLRSSGFGGFWTGEVNGVDGLAPLALVAGWDLDATVGCGVVSAFTRAPGVLAQSAATLGEIAPGRSWFGIGSGSNITVEQWNGVPFVKPYLRVEETLRFLRECLTQGAPLSPTTTFQSSGFRLDRPSPTPPGLLLAALGPRMQRLAAAAADGVILNFVGPQDAEQIRSAAREVARDVDGELRVVTRIFVVPGSSPASEVQARRHLAAYLNVPVYAAFQSQMGRGPALEPMWAAWRRGDRRAALAAIPDHVVSDLIVTGDVATCAETVGAFLARGVDVAIVSIMPPFGETLSPEDQLEFACGIAAATSLADGVA